jgi:hypothetical protein
MEFYNCHTGMYWTGTNRHTKLFNTTVNRIQALRNVCARAGPAK